LNLRLGRGVGNLARGSVAFVYRGLVAHATEYRESIASLHVSCLHVFTTDHWLL